MYLVLCVIRLVATSWVTLVQAEKETCRSVYCTHPGDESISLQQPAVLKDSITYRIKTQGAVSVCWKIFKHIFEDFTAHNMTARLFLLSVSSSDWERMSLGFINLKIISECLHIKDLFMYSFIVLFSWVLIPSFVPLMHLLHSCTPPPPNYIIFLSNSTVY